MTDTRYSKEQLLDLYKVQQSSDGGLRDGLASLYVGGWQPDVPNGVATGSWGRSDNSRDSQSGPDICWDRDGSIEPLGLLEMDDEEKEVWFAKWIKFAEQRAALTMDIALLVVCQHSPQTTLYE